MNIYFIDGRNIHDIRSLCDEFARGVNAVDGYFGNDLQSFDDCLFGGFGMEAPCRIIWQHSEVSKHGLNSPLLARYCADILENTPDINDVSFKEGKEWCIEALGEAKLGTRTMFDEVVAMISSVTSRACWEHKVELTVE